MQKPTCVVRKWSKKRFRRFKINVNSLYMPCKYKKFLACGAIHGFYMNIDWYKNTRAKKTLSAVGLRHAKWWCQPLTKEEPNIYRKILRHHLIFGSIRKNIQVEYTKNNYIFWNTFSKYWKYVLWIFQKKTKKTLFKIFFE